MSEPLEHPQYSPDGNYYWDGAQWILVAKDDLTGEIVRTPSVMKLNRQIVPGGREGYSIGINHHTVKVQVIKIEAVIVSFMLFVLITGFGIFHEFWIIVSLILISITELYFYLKNRNAILFASSD